MTSPHAKRRTNFVSSAISNSTFPTPRPLAHPQDLRSKTRALLVRLTSNFTEGENQSIIQVCVYSSITDANSSVVQCKGTNCELRSVFAEHSILLNNDSSDIFYFEISIKNLGGFPIVFGFAVKQQTKLDKRIYSRNGTYARSSNGTFWINGSPKGPNADYSYGVGDVVGCGFSSTRQIIFTKNGRRLYSSDLVEDSHFASAADGSLFPCVSLRDFDDKIEAKFGPDFKFDLDTL
ncbi:hypothetical protein niasHT_002439 [Heterodera trifolii]|uniref:B30.2/SPRY domain-containing protein n=1 Tax=Heterodera trifolii TaxID=157864 RepID=A0ABD2LM90_9BILA